MKQELRYRKDMQDLTNIVNEAKEAAKKKK